LATLGDEKAQTAIRESLAQDLDLGRLAWGIWAATETGQTEWAPLIAEHLDDGRPYLVLASMHDSAPTQKPTRMKVLKLRIDAMAARALAVLCHPSFSFKMRGLGSFAEFDYPPIQGDGDYDVIPQGFTPSHMKEVKDWWTRNRDKWQPRTTPLPSKPNQ